LRALRFELRPFYAESHFERRQHSSQPFEQHAVRSPNSVSFSIGPCCWSFFDPLSRLDDADQQFS
jgi:hypothetical protein